MKRIWCKWKKSRLNSTRMAFIMIIDFVRTYILIQSKYMAQFATNALKINASKNKSKNVIMAKFIIIIISSAKLATKILMKAPYSVIEMELTSVIPSSSKSMMAFIKSVLNAKTLLTTATHARMLKHVPLASITFILILATGGVKDVMRIVRSVVRRISAPNAPTLITSKTTNVSVTTTVIQNNTVWPTPTPPTRTENLP